jgi:acyl-CoA hydrolase
MTPADSRCVMTQIVMPMHTNGFAGILFGGHMMQWIDVCAGVAAMRHAAGAVTTASIDRLDFLSPVHVGEIVVLQAQVNYVSRTSMEVGIKVSSVDPLTGREQHTNSSYVTMVAVDAHGRPKPVPQLMAETAEEKRRYREAQARREARLGQ